MEQKEMTIRQVIEELLVKALENNVAIEGDPDGSWFVLKQVKLGQAFDQPEADIMVRFADHNNDPIILLPDSVMLTQEAHNVCPRFLEECSYIKGWRRLCPHMFQDVKDDILEFILCLTGFVSTPCLCGLMGCDGKTMVEINDTENDDRDDADEAS